MCGRYTSLTEDEVIKIRELLKNITLKDDLIIEPKEVYPTDNSVIILKDKDELLFESIKWGFKKWDGTGVIINARMETIKDKVTFTKLYEESRCVIPAKSFFEWGLSDDKKRKYQFKDALGNILYMAGLYRIYENVKEYVILTRKAVGEIAKIHDRMPVLLKVDQIESWLNKTISFDDINDFELKII